VAPAGQAKGPDLDRNGAGSSTADRTAYTARLCHQGSSHNVLGPSAHVRADRRIEIRRSHRRSRPPRGVARSATRRGPRPTSASKKKQRSGRQPYARRRQQAAILAWDMSATAGPGEAAWRVRDSLGGRSLRLKTRDHKARREDHCSQASALGSGYPLPTRCSPPAMNRTSARRTMLSMFALSRPGMARPRSLAVPFP
jgi:hypothetical protein